MGNTRGSTWSKSHESLDPCSSCPEFWDFSWDTTGTLDYSAEVDYILQSTGFEKVITSIQPEVSSDWSFTENLSPAFRGRLLHGNNAVLCLVV